MRRLAIWSVVVATSVALGSGATIGLQRWRGWRTTTTRLSPDETIRARLFEPSPAWGLDRNFGLRLEYLADDRVVPLIPRSEDQGRPEGTERLIWSKDGAWLLLVGRHFYINDDLFLDNGDQPYFLHHLATGRSWINSAEPSIFPPLKAEQVRAIEFTEPVRFRGE